VQRLKHENEDVVGNPETNSYQTSRKFKHRVDQWKINPESIGELKKLKKKRETKRRQVSRLDVNNYAEAIGAALWWTADAWIKCTPPLYPSQMEAACHVIGAALNRTMKLLRIDRSYLAKRKSTLGAEKQTLLNIFQCLMAKVFYLFIVNEKL